MLDKVKNRPMNSTQLWILSAQTCQWWNAVMVQAKRFFDILDDEHGGTPWDNGDNNSMFIAERMFLIVAIYHAIENLQKLDIEMQRVNDCSLSDVLNAINAVTPLDDIKNLRDMNIHKLDYLVEEGRKQNQFRSTITEGEYTIHTTAAWTVVHGDAKMILIGKVQIDKLILAMKEQLPVVQKRTKEIFESTLYS